MNSRIDFFGIGAARCGTTWLHECLKEHPGINLPTKKEQHFFDNDAAYRKGIEYYERNFIDTDGKLVQGEITPRYLLYGNALLRIRQHYPEAKIIVILRDPVERAFSQYKYFRFNKKKEDKKDFLTALESDFREDYIGKSLYYPQLKRVYEIFDRQKVLVIFTADISRDPSGLIRRVYEFLGVSTDYSPRYIDKKINSSQDGYFDPPVFWARFNKLLAYRTREVGGEVYTRSLINNRVLDYLLKSRLVVYAVNRINQLLDRLFASREKIRLDRHAKDAVFTKYFREDTQQLEQLLGISLAHWKPADNGGTGRTVSTASPRPAAVATRTGQGMP